MDKNAAELQYRNELRPLYESFAAKLHALLDDLVIKSEISVAQIEHRAKTVEGFLGKLERKNYEEPFQEIKDFAGVRVITYYQDDVLRVANLLRHEFAFDKDQSIDKFEELDVDEFGYRSLHLIISLKEPRKSLLEWRTHSNLSAEVQIRSVLQHAWASISHKLDYKIASQAPPELRRQLFRLSALLELADEEFQSLRDRNEKVVERYQREVTQGDLNISLNLSSLSEFLRQRLNIDQWVELGMRLGLKPDPNLFSDPDFISETERLLLTLQAIGISTLAEFAEMLPRLEKEAPQLLPEFVKKVRANKGEFYAVPIDMLTVLISLGVPNKVPKNFNWGGEFQDEITLTLREACNLIDTKSPA